MKKSQTIKEMIMNDEAEVVEPEAEVGELDYEEETEEEE